ncbi:hypothetical protein DR095_00830 [Mycoplasma flocculare]|uniref:Transmembrane protein n=1 Tax=Mesomycoplasma flocculare ATCC 27399 TaxID=743971 RepID=A0A0A8E6M8_MESFC|nr:hypothetical protein [Mesomycoplasma flocculare]MXR39272.1 hypothetical protein [Mycoplasma sp. MF12]AJC49643.1 hypothetical protein MYF_00310 [Mesomycoplasma flocculare ATCC 27399]ENX50856.1 hypothetical protein MFC_01379 [Mesomycoplasma flocculare ATCC 27716]MXR12056.1 hypothetical protein [Mesomycoplasma flocculare]MXR13316.1 hypothetical protein [Mesomycoplasma flocculare]
MDFESYKRTSVPKIVQIKKVNKIFLVLAIIFLIFFIALLTFYLVKQNDDGLVNDFIDSTWLAISLLCFVISVTFFVSFGIGIYKIKAMKQVEKDIENQLKEL